MESQYPQELSAAVDVISSINKYKGNFVIVFQMVHLLLIVFSLTNSVVDMRQPNDTFFDVCN